MRKLILLCTSLCAMVLMISASPVHAQSVLWVSSSGLDANPCSQISPCATFQGAINKGSVLQINCLTSGTYGRFTVTASITIDCGAGNIGHVVSGTHNTAVTLNTAAAATVTLRHLSLDGLDVGQTGIDTQLFSGGTLIVEDCVIHGFFNGNGITFLPSAGGRSLLHVSNSRIHNNNGGILVNPASGQIASLMFSQIELSANAGNGLFMGGSGVVAGTMRNSVVAANAVAGISANTSQIFFTVEESSIIANLGTGVQIASAGAVVNVGASTIGGNGIGIQRIGSVGSLISFGNNQMSANGSNGSFTSTTLLQ